MPTIGVVTTLFCLVFSPLAQADQGRFSLAVGTDNSLLILGPNGQTVTALNAETVGRHLVVNNTALEVSFGRDATGDLTVTLTGSDAHAIPLHFSACGKNIDADNATVTLSYSPDLKSVAVDPGYLGTVQVDSHLLRARSLADDVLTPSESLSTLATSATEMATSALPPVTYASVPIPARVPGESVAPVSSTSAPTPTNAPAPSAVSVPGAAALESPAITAPSLLASQIKPILPPLASATPTPASAASSYVPAVVTTSPDGTKRVKLYWAEPVTAPDGSAPSVAAEEIKLVEVHGMVTVTAPDGSTQSGTEGMAVATGSTVRTASNSSAALFMGGVNSARLMPDCELVVTQALVGSVRTNVIDLRGGAVFSRVGHRDGETENFSVTTPEGTTQAATTDMLAYRGTPGQLRAGPPTTFALPLDTHHLLAWDPAPTRGLLSDVPALDLGETNSQDKNQDQGQGGKNTYFYYADSKNQVDSNDIRHEVYCQGGKDGGKDGGNNNLGNGGGDNGDKNNLGNGDGKSGGGDCHSQYVLQQILTALQPYNCKLQAVLTDVNDGKASPAEQKFYHELTSVFFCEQEPQIVDQYLNDPKKFDKEICVYDKVLDQDLREFGLAALTPGARTCHL